MEVGSMLSSSHPHHLTYQWGSQGGWQWVWAAHLTWKEPCYKYLLKLIMLTFKEA